VLRTSAVTGVCLQIQMHIDLMYLILSHQTINPKEKG
jgi:hypothetical protein